MADGRVTRKEVARRAGTSVAVVSYVVNNGPRPVAEATRRRVLDVIEETGYRPDSVAKALASGRTATIGLVVPDIANAFFAQMAHSIEHAASDIGRVVFLGDSALNADRERALLDAYLDRKVDAIVLIPVGGDTPPHGERGVPLIVVDRIASAEFPAVTVDHEAGARCATEHLLQHGYDTIACIAGPRDLPVAGLRVDGWQSAIADAGMTPSDPISAEFTRRGGYHAGLKLMARTPRPRAVFVSNEQQAIGVLRAAAETGVAVPGDLALFTFDGTDDGEYTTPPLSSIQQPFEQMAQEVMSRIEGGAEKAPIAVCDFTVVVRRSCGCAL